MLTLKNKGFIMSKKVLILGAQHMSGVSKGKGTRYDSCVLFAAMPVRSWSNENGSGHGLGFITDEQKGAFECEKTPAFVEKLSTVRFPAYMELELIPDPQNPLKDIVVDFSVIASFSPLESAQAKK